MIRLVYCAGRYRAKTAWEVDCNIVAARQVGAEVVKLGAYPVIPHSNTAHFDGLAPDQFWLDGTLELMRRCDAVVLVFGWENSSGTKMELVEAERLQIPVLRTIKELEAWLISYGPVRPTLSPARAEQPTLVEGE